MCCCDPGDCLVCSVAILATVFPSCLCGLTVLVSGKVFWLVMGSDGIQTQKIKSCVSGQVRAERVLAEAITIDGRKEWTFGVECVDKMAGDVLITSRRRWTGSISMRSQQSEETGLLARRLGWGGREKSSKACKPRIKSVEHELSL